MKTLGYILRIKPPNSACVRTSIRNPPIRNRPQYGLII